jgi:hypothetical protein
MSKVTRIIIEIGSHFNNKVSPAYWGVSGIFSRNPYIERAKMKVVVKLYRDNYTHEDLDWGVVTWPQFMEQFVQIIKSNGFNKIGYYAVHRHEQELEDGRRVGIEQFAIYDTDYQSNLKDTAIWDEDSILLYDNTSYLSVNDSLFPNNTRGPAYHIENSWGTQNQYFLNGNELKYTEWLVYNTKLGKIFCD